MAYAPLIVSSQIVANQSLMRVPYRLYGFSSRRLFALAILEMTGPTILLAMFAEGIRQDPISKQYRGSKETLNTLCGAAAIAQSDVAIRHLPATAAQALGDPHCPLVVNPTAASRQAVYHTLLTRHGIDPTGHSSSKERSAGA
jgi:hypothetical protein